MTADLGPPARPPRRAAAPASGTERAFAEVLAEVIGVERVPVESHFFDDLGADSMVMARFCARVRKRGDLPSVSMREIYRHPTIRSLATGLADTAATAATPVEPPPPAPVDVAAPASPSRYAVCGALQGLLVLGFASIAGLVAVRGYEWVSAASGLFDVYLRSAVFGGTSFVGLCLVPILAKWVVIGRWEPQQIPIWSVAYVRFWAVKTLLRVNPLVLFAGSPLYPMYLRALGARVGRGVAIFSRRVPVCTDLLTIGDGAVIRKDSWFPCYRAHAGVIQTGTVTVGRGALVGEATVLDIDTRLGDAAQLGHSSSLHAGQVVPDGERWHGSPAQRTEVTYRTVVPARCGTVRRIVYSVAQLLGRLVVVVPLAVGGVAMLIEAAAGHTAITSSAPPPFTSWTFYGDALATSAVLLAGLVLAGLLAVVAVGPLLNLAILPDRVYPLYGVQYAAHRLLAGLSNRRFFTYLFGDSAAIVHYLRGAGYDLLPLEQTGSNFGLDVKHDNPYLTTVGHGTMVADGLSVINADFSSTSFRVSRATIGPRNFLGNYVAYPSQGRTGDNCLLATKVMVPIDGETREGVGLLGSPSFEIPRSVLRDSQFDHLRRGEELRFRLAAKTRHNTATMVLYLLKWWIFYFAIGVLATAVLDLYHALGVWVLGPANVVIVVFSVVYLAVVERAGGSFRALEPRSCSIYEPYFWWHERYWKLSTQPRILDGTPFKNLIWRLLGVRIGRRVFDDGCVIMEKTLVSIGDDCALNAGSIVQPHSQEDGAFKADRIGIGAGCTLGVGALVHYGVTMGDGSALAPDSFLMKGEEVPAQARWGGNPAREMRDHRATTTATAPAATVAGAEQLARTVQGRGRHE